MVQLIQAGLIGLTLFSELAQSAPSRRNKRNPQGIFAGSNAGSVFGFGTSNNNNNPVSVVSVGNSNNNGYGQTVGFDGYTVSWGFGVPTVAVPTVAVPTVVIPTVAVPTVPTVATWVPVSVPTTTKITTPSVPTVPLSIPTPTIVVPTFPLSIPTVPLSVPTPTLIVPTIPTVPLSVPTVGVQTTWVSLPQGIPTSQLTLPTLPTSIPTTLKTSPSSPSVQTIPQTTVQTSPQTTVQTSPQTTVPTTPSTQTSPTNTQTTASTAKPSPGSCGSFANGPYTDSAGTVYTISCSTDKPGGDLSAQSSSSFQGCFSICDNTSGCVGFAYVGGNNAGTCYLKSSLGTSVPNSNVDVAYTSKQSSAVAPPAPATPGSCAAIGNGTYTDDNKIAYTVQCQTDLAGSDLGPAASSTFQGCFDICDATSGCIAFTYLPGTCYLKSKVGTMSYNSAVNCAYKGSASGASGGSGTTCPSTVTVTTTVYGSQPT